MQHYISNSNDFSVKESNRMRKNTLIDNLKHEDISDMISEFQWMPERSCVRMALARKPEDNEILQSLNAFAGKIAMLDLQCRMSGSSIQLMLASLSFRFDAVRIDGGAHIAGAVELADILAVDQSLVGTVNFYTVTHALQIRHKFPERWNQFCNCAEKPGWKVIFNTVNATGLESTVELAESAELPESPVSLSGRPVKHCAEEIETPPTGLSLAFNDKGFYAMSEDIMQSAGGGKTVYYSNPDDEPDTGSGSQKDRQERDRLLEELREKARKKKGSRGL
jgi:hypothetical protein